MRLILSRKGFDSGSGGGPSPILPDGTMVSLPIPEPGVGWGGEKYSSIAATSTSSMADVMNQLGYDSSGLAHHDPDLLYWAKPRMSGWHAGFGQSGAASAHLINQGVEPGDLFVFWGLFRHTVVADGKLVWDPDSVAFHSVFGWLSTGNILCPGSDDAPDWAQDHPHVAAPLRMTNRVYLAADHGPMGLSGAGVVGWSPKLRLSVAGANKTLWALPAGCHPEASGVHLSYHGDASRWSTKEGHCELLTVARGQEFVVEATDAWLEWAESLLA